MTYLKEQLELIDQKRRKLNCFQGQLDKQHLVTAENAIIIQEACHKIKAALDALYDVYDASVNAWNEWRAER